MPSDNTMDYEVGYGKPPRDTQFKKGHSWQSPRSAIRFKEPGDIGD